MNRRLFAICVATVLALAGQASAQSVQFFGFGITCHKGYVGGMTPGAAFPGAAAAFPAPAYAMPTFAAPAYTFPAPAYTFATPTPPAATQPAAAPPAGNGDLVNAINDLTKAINALSGKLPGPTTTPTVPAPGKEPSKFKVLSANTPSVGEVTPQRKEIGALVAEAERLRAERSKTDTGLVSR